MAHLIDKDRIVAEIEKFMYSANLEADIASTGECFDEKVARAKYQLCKQIRDSIVSIEVKEVDLGKEIKNSIDSLSNLYCFMEELFNGTEEEGVRPIPEEVTNELFEFAKHFFELGLKTQKGE